MLEKEEKNYLKEIYETEQKAMNEKINNDLYHYEMLKKYYYDKYVIKELKEPFFAFGKKTLTEEEKQKKLKEIRERQKESLRVWMDFIFLNDSFFPVWFKKIALDTILQIEKYDKKTKKIKERTEESVEPFLELNQEALAKTYDMMNEENQNTKEIFQKYYISFLSEQKNDPPETTDGEWKCYKQGSSGIKLYNDLEDKHTGWSFGGEKIAKRKLSTGDVKVYYTNKKVPRILIKTCGLYRIEELRGVAKGQNLESSMLETAFLEISNEFSKKDVLPQFEDMFMLQKLEQKQEDKEELTKEELCFLYEIDKNICSFGDYQDSRIQKLIQKRNRKKDLAFLFDCQENNIGEVPIDFEQNDIFYYFGDLELDQIEPKEKLKKLKAIFGDVSSKEKTVDYLSNVTKIKGNVFFDHLEDAKGFKNLKEILGHAFFPLLKDANGLENLERILGLAVFPSLTNALSLNKLQSIGEDAIFTDLEKGCIFLNLKEINGDAVFPSLKEVDGFYQLEKIRKDAIFPKLRKAKGFQKLKHIGKKAIFSSLKSADIFKNIKNIWNDADFRSLIDATGLSNLKQIDGNAIFTSLVSSKGLESLETIEGDADFKNLLDASGLKQLREIKRNGNFSSLKDISGLENLKRIGWCAYFDSLKDITELKNLTVVNTIYGKENSKD